MTKPKILHHTTSFLPVSQTFVRDLLLSIAPHVEQQVMTHRIAATATKPDITATDISHRSGGFMRRLLNATNEHLGRAHNTNHKRAAKAFRQFKPDLIHCHFGTSAYFSNSVQHYIKRRYPTLVSLHGYDVGLTNPQISNYAEHIRSIAKFRTLFTCPSQYLKRLAVKTFQLSEEQVVVVPNGFNQTFFEARGLAQKSGDSLKICHIGRFVPIKGHQYLIQAISELVKAGITDVEVTLIGEGKLRPECEQLVSELNLNRYIHFVGAQSPEQVAKILLASDMYIHPSITLPDGRAETFGIALLEALASGNQIISTLSGGIPEVLEPTDSRFVRLVKEQDPSAIATALRELRLENNSQTEFKAYQAQILGQFSWDKTAQSILKCYEQLL